ncbi:terminase TerL endonuclease subunit [Lichenihabitans psoromatis]|uniref:terminase TerL endonuclease subunit n=1 Tax=Lichenihabitans psoromatis TaxID=2528642 RepID=UPI0010357C6E|nr:terminase TerL endonuclease subunit [Lichenihabitans psoromatis]
MIEVDPFLSSKGRFHIQAHKKKVTFNPTGATLQIKSFNPKVMTGVKPAGVMVDELHVIAESSDADRVMGQIRGGIVSQPEAFFAITTTQSERPPRGVFKAELAKARAIRNGTAGGKMLPVLYEFPDAIGRAKKEPDKPYPWESKAFWHMVTPNDGRSITVDRLVEDFDTAKLAGEEELRRWASQHLNVEIGMALGSDRWPGAEHWEKRADPSMTFENILTLSDVITVGIDGGGLDDLLGLAVIGRDKVTREWRLWIHAWMHRNVLERRKSEASNFLDFERDGDLSIVDDMGTAYAALVDRVVQCNDAGLLASVGLDPAGVGLIVDELSVRGISDDTEQVFAVSQGYKLTGAIKTLEVKLSDQACSHPGQPLMTWCVSNARVELRGNAVLITKQVSGTGKIDPLMSAFNATSLMAANPEPKGSVYTVERGLTYF